MNQDYTDISIILDRSGSMQTVANDTIGGFNQFVQEQKKQPGRALLSLYQFDDHYETRYEGRDIAEVPPLEFSPRGMTALYDAIGRTINNTGARLRSIPEYLRPGKVMMVILTDGFENASREFTKDRIKEMITHQRTKYQWDFVFLGANQDAILTSATIGIGRSSTLTYASNTMGVGSAWAAAANYTNSVRGAKGAAAGAAAFSDEDREAQAKAGA